MVELPGEVCAAHVSVRTSAAGRSDSAAGVAKPSLCDGVFLVAVMLCASRHLLITSEPARLRQTPSVC